MENNLIIRAGVDGGKTTTSGILFEELKKDAEFKKLYDYKFNEIDTLKYSKEGNLLDFIAVLIVNGKVIVIISHGDVAKQLEGWLDLLKDTKRIKKLTDNLSEKIDFYVLCARSQMRKNSTIEMLHNRIPSIERKEFWTIKSEDPKEKTTIKKKVVAEIISHIKQ